MAGPGQKFILVMPPGRPDGGIEIREAVVGAGVTDAHEQIKKRQSWPCVWVVATWHPIFVLTAFKVKALHSSIPLYLTLLYYVQTSCPNHFFLSMKFASFPNIPLISDGILILVFKYSAAAQGM